MLLIAPLLCLFLAAQVGERRPSPEVAWDDRVPDEGSLPHRKPADLHLSTFSTRLAAKLATDGSFDTGAGVLRFFKRVERDGQTPEQEAVQADWAPLGVNRLRYGRGPELWGTYFDKVDGAFVTLRAAAVGVGGPDDPRIELGVQVAFENPSKEPGRVRLRAELSPGGSPGVLRPFPSLDDAAGAVFGRDGAFITRDGSAILYVEAGGQQPTITLTGAPSGPDTAVAVFEWDVTLAPSEALGAVLHLAGPSGAPADARDEAAWRQSFERFSFRRLEELANWQSNVRPTYIRNRVGDVRLTRGMFAAIHYLRALGHGDQVLHHLTDRPFNQPPSDEAVEGPMLGSMLEWGLLAFTKERFDELVLGAIPRVGHLPPERRLAYLDGLVRGARLFQVYDHDLALAEAILELVEAGTAVPCWSDPDELTAEFRRLLVRAGLTERLDEVPSLAWAEPPAGSVAAHAVAVRRALAAGDRRAAWTAMQPILDATSIDGMGSMQAGQPYDGTFPVMFMSLVRALLIDDWGDELALLPGLVDELVPYSGKLTLLEVISRFGQVNMSLYWSLKDRVLSGSARLVPWVSPDRVTIGTPEPFVARGIKMQKGAGSVKVAPGGVLELDYEPFRVLEFNVNVGAVAR